MFAKSSWVPYENSILNMSGFHLTICPRFSDSNTIQLTRYPTSCNKASAAVSAILRLQKQSVEFGAPFASAVDRACHGNAWSKGQAHQPAPHQRWRVVQRTGRPSRLEGHPRRPERIIALWKLSRVELKATSSVSMAKRLGGPVTILSGDCVGSGADAMSKDD